MMMCECDCLNFCGDDPRLYKGTVKPCANFLDGTIKNKKRLVEKRVLDAAVFGMITIIPMALWSYRNYRIVGSQLGLWEKPDVEFWHNVWLVITKTSGWFFPLIPSAIALILFGVGIAVIFWPFYHYKRKGGNVYLILSMVFVACYAVSILVLASFFSNIPLQDRILSPLLPFLLITGLLVVSEYEKLWQQRISFKYLIPLLLIMLLPMLFKTYDWSKTTWREGAGGFLAKKWRESEAIKWLNVRKEKHTLYSQAHDALIMNTRYQVRDLPYGYEKDSLPDFFTTVRITNGLIVYLDNIPRPKYISEADLIATGKLTEIGSAPVKDFMTANVTTLQANDTLASAIYLMSIHRFRHILLVDDDGKPSGVLSSRRVAQYIQENFAIEN